MARQPLSITDFFSTELPFVTEFRRLLQKISESNGDNAIKTLLITSAMLSEGKSTITSFLSLVASKQKHMKTLVVDADLRRPTIHKYFALQRERGLVEVLEYGLVAQEAIKHTSIDTLDVLTAGRSSHHPSETFDPDAIDLLLTDLKFYYDIVLVDCAPVLPVSDPMLLAGKLDAVLLVVKAGHTRKEIARRAVEILDSTNTRILGTVVNNMSNSLPYHYNSSYYGYTYTPDKSDQKIEDKRKKTARANDSTRSGKQDRQIRNS